MTRRAPASFQGQDNDGATSETKRNADVCLVMQKFLQEEGEEGMLQMKGLKVLELSENYNFVSDVLENV